MKPSPVSKPLTPWSPPPFALESFVLSFVGNGAGNVVCSDAVFPSTQLERIVSVVLGSKQSPPPSAKRPLGGTAIAAFPVTKEFSSVMPPP